MLVLNSLEKSSCYFQEKFN